MSDDRNSSGPLGQFDEITFLLQNDASIITAPGSSHKEVETTAIEFLI